MAAILNFKMAANQNDPPFQLKVYYNVKHHNQFLFPKFEPSTMLTTGDMGQNAIFYGGHFEIQNGG